MKTIKDNLLLCEIPEWGLGPSRCQHVGFRIGKDGYAGPWLCLKFNEEELKETSEGWLVRCDTCANGGYTPRGKIEDNSNKPPIYKSIKIKPSLVFADMRNLPEGLSIESIILWALEHSRGPVIKSQLQKIVNRVIARDETDKYSGYPGYVDSQFVWEEEELRASFTTAFSNLVKEGYIYYGPRKPVKIIYL